MKDIHVSIASVEVNTSMNEIPRERIKIEARNGRCQLKDGVLVALEWPLGVEFSKDENDLVGHTVTIQDICRTPRRVQLDIALEDLDEPDIITKVALAKITTLKVYADFPEEKLTFELVSSAGESYGMQSISIYDEKIQEYFDLEHD